MEVHDKTLVEESLRNPAQIWFTITDDRDVQSQQSHLRADHSGGARAAGYTILIARIPNMSVPLSIIVTVLENLT